MYRLSEQVLHEKYSTNNFVYIRVVLKDVRIQEFLCILIKGAL